MAMATVAMAMGRLFDSGEFWERFPANDGARRAWENGVKWTSKTNPALESVIVYDNDSIYGFVERKIPPEHDPNVKARIIKAYIDRSEMQAIHEAGLFAFNSFDCSAKSNIGSITPNIQACSNIKILSKLSSDWNDYAFSIAKLSTDQICSCRQVLDTNESNNNYNIFFGPIARYEISRLYENNNQNELIDFFTSHHKKNIFDYNHFLMTTDFLIQQKRHDDANILLDVIITRFADKLNSEDWEKCGDYYLILDQKDKAINSFTKASELLNNSAF
ncbi:MAG: hypothetical protein LBF58_10275 [Deltaproteobacteria bacterium]|jgi:tetratricopeptide (TPR) repeat protein|nr:hypothetical protein [Deltaproteobacteria bacterium]